RLVSKIAGGAQMFSFGSTNDLMRIGERNAVASKKKLNELRIRLLSEDIGENYGRTIEFYSETGDLLIKTIGKPPKTI
ncbi:MAG: chemotaxis protein CheD, partial [Firmicutes bacterium HGW-Firmicutes-3]